jgi:hypothetical protein
MLDDKLLYILRQFSFIPNGITSLCSSQRTGVTPVSVIAAFICVMLEVFCRSVPFQDYLFGMCGRKSNRERDLPGITSIFLCHYSSTNTPRTFNRLLPTVYSLTLEIQCPQVTRIKNMLELNQRLVIYVFTRFQ